MIYLCIHKQRLLKKCGLKRTGKEKKIMVFPYLILSFLTGIIFGMLIVILIKNKHSKKRLYIPFDETPNDYNLITISAVCGEKTLKFIIDSGAGGGCIINPKVLQDIPHEFFTD